MMFLLRAAFWLSIAILILPANEKTGDPAPGVSAIEALMAVRATVGDLSQFCTRQPDVCSTGGAAFEMIAEKVIAAAETIFDRFAKGEQGPPPGDGTLTPGDVEPEWREPEADPQV